MSPASRSAPAWTCARASSSGAPARRYQAAARGQAPARSAVARRLERAAACRERLGDGQQLPGGRRLRDLGGTRGEVGVQRQAHRQRAVAQLQRQWPGVGEPPDPLVKGDRARKLAALGRDAGRLGVGAVRDQIVDEIAVRHGRLPCSHSLPARVRSIAFDEGNP